MHVFLSPLIQTHTVRCALLSESFPFRQMRCIWVNVCVCVTQTDLIDVDRIISHFIITIISVIFFMLMYRTLSYPNEIQKPRLPTTTARNESLSNSSAIFKSLAVTTTSSSSNHSIYLLKIWLWLNVLHKINAIFIYNLLFYLFHCRNWGYRGVQMVKSGWIPTIRSNVWRYVFRSNDFYGYLIWISMGNSAVRVKAKDRSKLCNEKNKK